MFREIIMPFLSTISLRNNENFLFASANLNVSLLLRAICVILIEKMSINEKKKEK